MFGLNWLSFAKVWKCTVSQALVNEPIPFLVIKSCFTQTRNQLRQKLARFNAAEFSMLLIEILTDSKRRYSQLDTSKSKEFFSKVQIRTKEIFFRKKFINVKLTKRNCNLVRKQEWFSSIRKITRNLYYGQLLCLVCRVYHLVIYIGKILKIMNRIYKNYC